MTASFQKFVSDNPVNQYAINKANEDLQVHIDFLPNHSFFFNIPTSHRLLRFEEKSALHQEIKHLHEKYGEEERNNNKLERQLKKFSNDNLQLEERIQVLEREHSVGK